MVECRRSHYFYARKSGAGVSYSRFFPSTR